MDLATSRLTLRPLEESDVEPLWPYVSDPSLPRMMMWAAHKSRDETLAFIAHTRALTAAGIDRVWAIREGDALVGTIGLHRISHQAGAWETHHGELGYWIAPARQNQGLATEASRAVIDHAFDTLGLHKITVTCLDANLASQRVIEKLGFRFVGLRRDHLYRDDLWWHTRDYEMTIAERPV
jgi:ribosomal-protein-alanine N-acetyltransferase